MVKEGDRAPGFELERDGGEIIRLKDFAGSPVILYFYPKDDTSGCTKEAIAFTELAGAFAARGAAIVGISPDSAARHDKFKAKHGLKVILAADTEKSTAGDYGVWVEKSMYGRKYMGVERSTFLIGGDGRIARMWRKVKVPGHAEAVLDALNELISPSD
jgi:peroxiredoxin Q/BCP